MAEWFKAHAWKACVRETVPRVRIPLSPPTSARLRRASDGGSSGRSCRLASALRARRGRPTPAPACSRPPHTAGARRMAARAGVPVASPPPSGLGEVDRLPLPPARDLRTRLARVGWRLERAFLSPRLRPPGSARSTDSRSRLLATSAHGWRASDGGSSGRSCRLASALRARRGRPTPAPACSRPPHTAGARRMAARAGVPVASPPPSGLGEVDRLPLPPARDLRTRLARVGWRLERAFLSPRLRPPGSARSTDSRSRLLATSAHGWRASDGGSSRRSCRLASALRARRGRPTRTARSAGPEPSRCGRPRAAPHM